MVKNLPASAGDIRDVGSVPGLGRSPGGGHGNPLQPGRVQAIGLQSLTSLKELSTQHLSKTKPVDEAMLYLFSMAIMIVSISQGQRFEEDRVLNVLDFLFSARRELPGVTHSPSSC